MTALDMSFLDVPLLVMSAPPRPVNVYEVLRDGWRETRVDMSLQFFLDPTERHDLGPLVMDALLRTLDGSQLIDLNGRTGTSFVASDSAGSSNWEIRTQAEYIDVLAVNRDLRLAVVLENKIGHELHNPLDVYARRALQDTDVDQVLLAVLAPETRIPNERQAAWLSASITYSEFVAQIKSADGFLDYVLNPNGRDQRRSLDLLQQFFEARDGVLMKDFAGEAAQVEEWRSLLHEHAEALKKFDDHRRAIGALLRDRNIALGKILAEDLPTVGPDRIVWEAHSGGGMDFWNAYDFGDEATRVELKLTTMPDRPNIYVQWAAAGSVRRPTIEPLGLSRSAADAEIVRAFVDRASVIVSAVREGKPPPPAPES